MFQIPAADQLLSAPIMTAATADGLASLEALLEASPDAITVVDLQRRIVRANARAAELHGFGSPDEMIGMDGAELTDPEYSTRAAANRWQVLDHGAIHGVEYRLRRKDGTLSPAELSASVVRDASGAPVGFVSIVRDITERKRAEEELAASRYHLEAVLANAPILLWAIDANGTVTLAEGRGYANLGIDTGVLVGRHVFDDYAAYRQIIDNCRRALAGESFDVQLRDGQFTFDCHYSPLRDERGAITGAFCVALDASDRARAEDARSENEAYLSTIFDYAPIGMAVADMDGRFIKTNRALQSMLQYSEEEMNGMHWTVTSHPDDIEAEDHLDDLLVSGEIDHYSIETRSIRKDGSIVWTQQTVSEVWDDAGQPIFGIAMMEDITERKSMEEALAHQALHDALTGLPNRVLFRDRVDQALQIAKRESHSLAVLLMDLDRFKELNDTFGHHHGDLLLQQFAQRLGGVLRPSDTVARLGGDEFAILLPSTDERAAAAVASKIRQSLVAPFVLENHNFLVDGSIGIALFPGHGEDTDTLVRRADIAMYTAKRSSSGHAVYVPEQDAHLPEHYELTGDLRQAIEGTGFVLHYQPKIDLKRGMVGGVEALVRWQHPKRGLLFPDTFIPVAERTGLIKPLTLWVVEEAARQQREWREAGINLDIAVNLSARNLQDWEIVQLASRLAHGAGGDGLGLTFEITESAIVTDPERAVEIVERLRALGIRIAIDDFGTGYASLTYLRRLPVDEIKLDRSFISEMRQQEDSAFIVRSIIDLAHKLKRTVVAEGVEDRATCAMLTDLSCGVAQGYLFSRPLPGDEFVKWLQSYGKLSCTAGLE